MELTIRSLKDELIADASLQYRIESETGYVNFAVMNGELCAHTWQCPKEGKRFLKALEEHAEKNGLRLIVPNVLNPALEHILRASGYVQTPTVDEYLNRECVVWSKYPTIVIDEVGTLFQIGRQISVSDAIA